ncbi:glycosyltransferase [Nocardioides marmoraquaticus]
MSTAAALVGVVAVVSGLAFLHPFVLYPLSLRVLPRRPVSTQAADGDGPRFSLLICAYDEIACIHDKLANLELLHAAHPRLEVLAYDDASGDGTYEALAARPDLVRVVRGAGRTGKAHGMKVLAAQASGEVLVFTDANVTLDPAALEALAATYRDPEVGGVCGRLVYTSSADATSTETVGGLYWRLEESTKAWESRTGNVMGADGSIFSVRTALYPDFPDTVQDDFTVSMNVLFAGRRLVRDPGALARESLVTASDEEFRRKVRIAARAFHTHRHLRPGLRRLSGLDRYKYVSHKVLRWHAATSLLTCAVATVLLAGLLLPPLGLALALVVVVALALGTRLGRPRLWQQGREVVAALVATNLGVWQALRGRTYQTWQPPPR